MQGMQLHPLVTFWAKLIRFGKIWLVLSDVWENLGKKLANLGKSY